MVFLSIREKKLIKFQNIDLYIVRKLATRCLLKRYWMIEKIFNLDSRVRINFELILLRFINQWIKSICKEHIVNNMFKKT